MLTSPKGRDSEKLWPSLAMPTADAQPSSFFGDLKVAHVSKSAAVAKEEQDVGEEEGDDEDECKAPAYKNNLSDALINALRSKASLSETKSASGGKSKKKGKKTLLFSSGMNFN